MVKGFFVTGTDTAVGKTVVTAALIRALHILGLRACGMKPVETGCLKKGGVLIPSDGTFLKNIARMDEQINHIVLYCLEAPLAPMVAGELEGVTIEPWKIKKGFDELSLSYEAIVVEGTGGLLVPLRKDYSVADMAKDIGLPLIVVARPTLGTINHTLLTVSYAPREGMEVAGVIMNFCMQAEGSLAEETNAYAIRTLCPVPLIGIMPYLADMSDDALERAVLKNLDLGIIKKYL